LVPFLNTITITVDELNKYIILSVLLHSIIILGTIFIPSVRDFIFGLTGYIHRGQSGLRSPGITISFNATAIVHVVGLYILMLKKHPFRGVKKKVISLIMFSSLLFLGRTISFIGIAILIVMLIKKLNKSAILIVILSLVMIPISLENLKNNKDIEKFSPSIATLLINYKVFMSPLTSNSDVNIYNYNKEVLGSHIFFNESLITNLFGNSRTGHSRLIDNDPKGETGSDLGIINSINANGIIGTTFIVFFYISIYLFSNKDDLVGLVCFLSLILSFKELGFLTSHATPLLFIYALTVYKNKNKCVEYI
tara:strand:- start:1583 stop:2506 length:924 start_codon:yes stop_codon:yes gene_type:complete